MVPLFYDCVVFNGGGFWFLVFDKFFCDKKGGGSMYLVVWYRGKQTPVLHCGWQFLKLSVEKSEAKVKVISV